MPPKKKTAKKAAKKKRTTKAASKVEEAAEEVAEEIEEEVEKRTNKPNPIEALGLRDMEEDDSVPEGFAILVYGPSGAGKTRFCMTAPGPLVIDCDKQGSITLKKAKGVYVMQPTEGLLSIRHVLERYHTGELPFYDEAKDQWIGKTLCIDPITEVHRWMRNVLSEGVVDSDKVPWDMIQEKIQRVIREVRDLTAMGVNVIFTATEQSEKDEGLGVVRLTPEMYGKMSSILARIVDCTFYFVVREGVDDEGFPYTKRALSTSATERVFAKVRAPIGVDFPFLIKPDFQALLDIWSGGDPQEWSMIERKEENGTS